MKHIKTINELFDNEGIEYNLVSATNNFVTYQFESDNKSFKCIFTNCEKDVWERDYSEDYNHREQININPYKIISTITNITIDFINSHKPKFIIINHLPMIGEKLLKNDKNKRAKVNYNFLSKNLPINYKLYYYNKGNNTYCIIYNDSFDISNFKSGEYT